MRSFTPRRIRTFLAGATLALTAFAGIGAATAPMASARVTIGTVTSYGNAYWNGCSHTVWASPWTNENVYGRYSAYFRLAVYDTGKRNWTWTAWSVADGINTSWVRTYAPGATAYIEYTRYINGRWYKNGEYRAVDFSAVDNIWCNAFGG